MDNLNNSNLILRTLQPKEYTQLVDDLNYNFLKILSLPGFKGIRGQSIQGDQGIGVRGSKWIFVQLQDVAQEYNLTDYTQITREWINTVYQDDAERFFSTLYIPNDTNLLLGDILVLPDGDIILLSEHTNSDESVDILFVDAGMTFNDVTSVSENRVIEIFQELYTQSNTGNGATRHYRAVAKNATDASPQLNTRANIDSAVDIVSSDSGSGAPLPDYSFLGTTESAVTPTTQLCQILGSAKTYHRLVGATQENFNNDFVPGVDDFAALVVLQNNNKNGILFGNKNNTDLRKFGRLYNNGGSTILTSSNSPIQAQFSDLVLTDTHAIIRSLKATIATKTLDIFADELNSNFLSWNTNGVYLKRTKSADILSTAADGLLVKKFSVSTTVTESATDIPTSKAIFDRLKLFTPNQDGGYAADAATMAFLRDTINAVHELTALGGTNYILKGCTVSGNTASNGFVVLNGILMPFQGGTVGTHVQIYDISQNPNQTAFTRFAKFGSGAGSILWSSLERINPLLEVQRRLVPKQSAIPYWGRVADISRGWALCDGGTHNGVVTPNLSGMFIVGLDPNDPDYDAIGKTGGEKKVTLDIRQMPSHNHDGNTAFGGSHAHTYPGDDGLSEWATPISPINYDSGSTRRNTGKIYRTPTSEGGHSHSLNINNKGGGESHENRPPYYTMAYITYVGV